jgi:hypothetical protein
MVSSLLAYFILVVRVSFLMLYLGLFLAFLANRSQIRSLSPPQETLFLEKILPRMSRQAWIYLAISSIAGVLLLPLASPSIPFIALLTEGIITLLMFSFAIVLNALASKTKNKTPNVIASPLDSRFKWVSVKGQADLFQTAKWLGFSSFACAALGVFALYVGLTISGG